jgi:branched-subunit amino acid ABC-type transport system permease component
VPVEFDLLKPVLVLGLMQAGMYGLLPISVVLSYRISRTIAFVHGGLAIFGALAYEVLVSGSARGGLVGALFPVVDPLPALLLVLCIGAVLGAAYGVLVMSRRVAQLPGMVLTVLSLGLMLLTIAVAGRFVRPAGVDAGLGQVAPTPFGGGGVPIWGQVVTAHRFAVLLIVLGLVLVLALVLNRTYTGLAIRAIADDLEASVWCGTKLRLIGAGVYAIAGAVSAMAGALFVATVAAGVEGILLLFMRALVIALVGGLRSVSLALAGALLFGVLDTALQVGFFGEIGGGRQEFLLSAAMMGLILLVARTRKESFFLLGRPSL